MNPPCVKVCCIKSREEAALAIAHGASALGLVSSMPSGPGVIDEADIARIAREVPPPVATFLLTSETDPWAILTQHARCGTNTLQLCDYLDHAAYPDLRRALPVVRLVQVIHVTGPDDVARACEVAPLVDALLLDSGRLDLPVKELGGTGRTHDWSLSRRIREESGKPVFLAGGLTAANVAEAIETVRPFGVDLCSGVRTRDQLDAVKLQDFFAAVRSVDPGRRANRPSGI